MDLQKGPAAGGARPVLTPSLTALETLVVRWAVSLCVRASALQYTLGLKSLYSWFLYFSYCFEVAPDHVTIFAVLCWTIYGSFVTQICRK